MAVIAAISTGNWGCKLNRDGLSAPPLIEGGVDASVAPDATGAGGASGTDGGDAPVDTGSVVCDTPPAQHACGTSCVSNSSVQTCGSSCTPCPVPANGAATCNGTSCGVTCNSGFTANGTNCLACSNSCDAGATTITAPGGRYTGHTQGNSSSAGSCGGGAAPEAVYKLVLTAGADVFVTTHGTGFNTVLYMRRGGCCGAEVACNDDADGRATSVIAQPNLAAGTYYIFVDGAAAGQSGDFTLDVYASPTSDRAAESCGRPGRIADRPVSADSCMLRNDYDSVNGCSDQDTSGRDGVYYFILDARTNVTFTTCNMSYLTCIDTLLYVRDVCSVASSQEVCNDDACDANPACGRDVSGKPSTITMALDPGVHYLVTDTYSDDPSVLCGMFTVVPTNVPP